MLRVGVRLGRSAALLGSSRHLATTGPLAAIQLKMPSLSPTMSEGTIVKWLKNEGEKVEPGDVVCDIQTDKAVVSLEVDEEGILAKIIKPADSGAIKVGEVIGVVAEEGEDWRAALAAAGGGEGDSQPASAPPTPAPEAAATAGGSVPGTSINMPSLSPTMSEGTIVKWYKAEGEAISAGELLCDIQTDKAVVSMESDDEGVLAKILVPEGATGIEVGKPIAIMVEAGQDWRDVAIPVPAAAGGAAAPAPAVAAASAAPAPAVAAATAAPVEHHFTHPAMTGPATALLLSQYNIKPESITGSGPKGNILKSDVLRHIAANNLSPVVVTAPAAPPAKEKATAAATPSAEKASPPAPRPRTGYVDIELSNMRKVIARRLTESKQTAPHGYSSATACIDAVNRLRQDYISSGHKVSVNDFIIKAVATALQYVPELNVNIVDEAPVAASRIDISVAVATDAGLITPIVKDAAAKSVQQISAEVKELAGRARVNKLKLDEFQGGSFTISNLGMFGIAEFTAIINAPQAAILAVGGGRQIIDPDTMRPKTVMTSTLSFDRRFIDEALAADFMTVFRTLMERPELLGTGFLASVRTDRTAAQIN